MRKILDVFGKHAFPSKTKGVEEISWLYKHLI